VGGEGIAMSGPRPRHKTPPDASGGDGKGV